jgi:anti-sigma factor RsiW
MERLQDRLDDVLPAAERVELERELAADPAAAGEAHALESLARLARNARVTAPAGFGDRVMRAIAADTPGASTEAMTAPRRTISEPPRSFWSRLFGSAHGDASNGVAWLRPGLAGALALAALAVAATLLFVRLESRAPGGRPATELATRQAPSSGATGGEDVSTEVVTHRFVLQAPTAQKVCLVGDFNQWKLCEVPMTKDADGHWVADVKLPRGRPQYRFVVADQEWQTDPRADVKVDDGFGNQNAVVFL